MSKIKSNSKEKTVQERYEAEIPDTLDLAERAKLGLNHFTELIEEKIDYEMYFAADFNYHPPVAVLHVTGLSCCQAKALEVMPMLRLMSGSTQHLDREEKMVGMMVSLLGDDGLQWIPIRDDKPWMGKEIGAKEPYTSVPGNGRMLYAMRIWYQWTGDNVWKKRIDRMVDGLDKLAVHKDDYAYFPVHGGIGKADYIASFYAKSSGWRDTKEPKNEKEGEEGSLFNHQGMMPGVLANWYILSGNEKALRLAGELTRFLTKPIFWADWQAGEYPGVAGKEHAHWQGHFHGHINVLRSILEYAIAVNNTRLKTFVRDGYEWTRQRWCTRVGFVGDGQGCGLGRLIRLAVKLTDAGIGDYWEDVDMYIRNCGTEMQFTEDDVEYLLKVSEGKPAPQYGPPMNNPERVIDRIIGGFASSPVKSGSILCCSTQGNMGLYYAWDGTLRYADGVARVNLLLNRASPWLDIDSYLPYQGKVVIKNKAAKEAFVRIPQWVNRKEVKCQINKQQISLDWFDSNNLRFKELKKSDVLTIEFPMVETTEQYTILAENSWVHTCKFKGNTLIEISPHLPTVPSVLPFTQLYKNRGHYWGNKAPMKKVERYVTDKVLHW